jgi:hypothetical protein
MHLAQQQLTAIFDSVPQLPHARLVSHLIALIVCPYVLPTGGVDTHGIWSSSSWGAFDFGGTSAVACSHCQL